MLSRVERSESAAENRLVRMLLAAGTAAIMATASASAFATSITLERIKVFPTGIFDGSAAEIVDFDPGSQRLFVTNSNNKSVDIFDPTGPTTPIGAIAPGGGGPNSVAVRNGIVAVAVEAPVKTAPGFVSFYDTNGNALQSIGVGSLPDMLTFTPDGRKVLVANEGEPDGGINPLGTVSIIDISNGVGLSDPAPAVTTVDFSAFNGSAAALVAEGANFAPGTTVDQDVEPEYIAIAADGTKAFVANQETNTIGVIDIETGTATDLFGLGLKDHSLPGNGLDPSDRDGGINIAEHPVFGVYQPDAIASYEVGGVNYIVTANEGDAREGEDVRVKNLTLDPAVFPDPSIQDDDRLGRLDVISTLGDFNGDGQHEALFSYGGRSFSIFDETGNLVFDSGDAFEQIIASIFPDQFNSNNDENGSFESRSDNKGPEPEALTIGTIDGQTLAFIGLERMGGIMVFDITDPFAPDFLTYQNDRDFGMSNSDLQAGLGLGLGPEGLKFVSAADNAFGRPLLLVANEVSGSTEVYTVNVPEPAMVGLLGVGLAGLVGLRRRKN